MRKSLWLLPLLIGAGCRKSQPGAEPTTLRVVIWRPDNPQAWDQAVALFQQTHPGIRVALEVVPNNSTQFHDLLSQKLRNQDSSLDAFLMDVVWTSEFAKAGWAAPLDSRFPAGERRKFFPGCIQADTFGGKVYGVPLNTDAGVLYYRKDLLDKYRLKPPATWPEMLQEIETIRSGEKNPSLYGFSGQFKRYEGLICNLLEYIRSNGGDLIRPDTPEAAQAVTFVRDRIIAAAAPQGVLTYEEQESLDLFESGGAIFLRSWPYAWAVLNRSALAGRVGIARLPAFKKGRHVSALGGWHFGTSAYSRHPDQAWQFVSFMTSPEIQKLFAIQEGKAPARRALYHDKDILKANPRLASLLPVFESAAPRPRSPVYPQISYILQQDLHATISDKHSDVAALLKNAAKKINESIRQVQ